jgi:hypothetical protein
MDHFEENKLFYENITPNIVSVLTTIGHALFYFPKCAEI